MVIKVEIELDEIWSDGESTLSQEIQHSIKLDVKQQILANIKETSQLAITKAVQDSIESGLDATVQAFITASLEDENFKVKYYGRDELKSMKDILEQKLRDSVKNADVARFVKKQLDDSYNLLKRRYDLEFASQFLAKLKENNMLSQSGMDLLMPTPTLD